MKSESDEHGSVFFFTLALNLTLSFVGGFFVGASLAPGFGEKGSVEMLSERYTSSQIKILVCINMFKFIGHLNELGPIMKKRFHIITLICSFLLLILANSRYYYEQLGGIILIVAGIIGIVLFILIAINALRLSLKLFKKPDLRSRGNFIVLGIALFVLFESLINPFHLSLGSIQSKIEFEACYEGTVNSAYVAFRKNHNFSYAWVGPFGFSSYYKGSWNYSGDTLVLKYNGEQPGSFYGKLLEIDNTYFRIEYDSLINTWFYPGYCKGLN